MELDVHAIDFNPFEKLNKRWMLLSCTDGVKANSMTAGWASGRDEDKLALCGLSPVIEEKTVYFKEAKLVITGKLIAQTDLSSSDLLDRGLESFYPKKDYHRLYVCEMLRAFRASSPSVLKRSATPASISGRSRWTSLNGRI